MCGRYSLTAGTAELVEAFDVPVPEFEMPARYNIAPGQEAVIVAEDRRGRRAGLLTWGLVPSWSQGAGKPLINARSESVLDRPSFRESFERRRCLVPADGFYEWKQENGGKTPYWIHPEDGGLVSFAAIWDRWEPPGEETRHSFAVLTMPSGGAVAAIHDRMPVVIDRSDRARWLARGTDAHDALALVRATEQPLYDCRAVSPRVNRPDQDDPALIDPA